MPRSALAVTLLLALPAGLRSQATPALVSQGLDQLVAGRPDSAVAIWTWAWNSPDDTAKRTQLVDAFRRLPEYAGPVLSYELIRIINITLHLRRAYFLLRCERQPAYLLIVLYQPKQEWSVTTINWHTDADHVLPPSLLGPEHPKP